MRKPKFPLWLAIAGVTLSLTARAQTRILPFGDSITSDGSTPESSYRYWLWHLLVNAGENIDFVGTQFSVADGEPANSDFDQDHEGHPGWTSQDALNNVDGIIAATQPDVVLMDFGGNDVIEGIDLQVTKANLEAVIEHLRAANPNVVILLADPTPWVTTDPNERRQMSLLKGVINTIAKEEKSAGANVIKVNLFGGFNAVSDTKDGTHPDVKGEQKIARKYFSALRKILR